MQVVCCDHATSCTGYIALVFAAAGPSRRHIRQERYSAYGSPVVIRPQKRFTRTAIPSSPVGEVRRLVGIAFRKTLASEPEKNNVLFHPNQAIQTLRLTLTWRLRRITNSPPIIMAPPRVCAAFIDSPSQLQAAAIATIGVRFWIIAA